MFVVNTELRLDHSFAGILKYIETAEERSREDARSSGHCWSRM
jgi:hypothetical protein